MKRLLLLPFLFCYSFLVKAQVQPVSCDLFLSSAEIIDQSGNPLDANLVSFNQVVKFQVTIGNSDVDDAAPSGHFRVTIGLGSGFTLNPGFNLATAPLSNIFNWTYDLSGSQPRIIGTSKAALPANATGTAEFELKATTAANSFISGNFQVSNPPGTQTPLSDPNFSNNGTLNNYNIAQDLVLSTTSQNVSCSGGNNGSITASATGGYTPYTFSINPMVGSQSGGSFTNLTAGVYTITVTDASNNNNSKNTQVTITQPTALSVTSATATTIACSGGTSTLTIAAMGGTGTLTYTVNPGNLSNTTGIFSGLLAGNYSYSVTDANNCGPVTGIITITQPAAITGSGAVTSNYNGAQISCPGSTDGVITVTASGGTGTLQYSLNGGAYQTGNVFSGLGAGSYFISVQDANNCIVSFSNVTITAPVAISGSAAVSSNYNGSQISCAGASDAAITVTATGGTAPLQYSINGGATYQTGNVFSGLGAGSYAVSVKDANGCTFNAGTVTITAPSTVTGSGTVTSNYNGAQISCNTSTDGVITASGSGGTGTLQYSLNNGTFQTSTTFTGLGAGTYTLAIKDANGCTFNAPNVVITAPATISATTNFSTINCNGGTSTLTITGSGGTGALTYTLNPGNQSNTTGVFANLPAGTYTYSVTDVNNCPPATGTVMIGQPAAIAVTAIPTNASCNGGNGSAALSATGGTGGPYTFTSSGGTISGSTLTAPAGIYTITAKDVNNCSGSVQVTITEPAAITVGSANKTDANCNGASTGSITLQGAGGTSPYTYTVTGVGTNNTGNFTGLAAGTYNFSITDVNTCTPATGSLIISQPAVITAATATATNANCNGASTGSITLSGAGGTGAYSYTISGTGSNTSGAISGNFTNLPAGTYNYSITDANNCAPATGTLTVGQPTALSTSETHTNVSCFGGTNGTAIITASGGTSPYNFTLGATTNTTGSFTGLAAGNYSVTITDANSCTTTQAVTITQPAAALTSSITSQTNVACFGSNSGSVTVLGANGTSPYTYSIDGTNFQGSGTFGFLTAGSYTITVKDANSCTTTQAVNITGPAAALTSSITSQTNVACFGGSTGSVTVTGASGTSPYTYSIDGTNFQSSGMFGGLSVGSYTITVKDNNGCTTTQAVSITQPAAALSATIASQTNVACSGASTGSVTVTGAGGTPGYSYTLGATTNTTGTFTGLAAGNYSVTVTDANSCTTVQAVTITQPTAALTASITSQTNVACFGNFTGSVTVTGANGTSPYTYSIDGTTFQSSGTFNGLTAGSYTVTVKDNNGCTTTQAVSITGPAAVLSSSITSQTNVLCFGNSTGSVTVAGSGGTPSYSYTLGTTTNTTGTFTGLAAGNYSVTVTDANSCTTAQAVTITQPTAALVATETHTNVDCFGNSTGSATISATGGTGSYTGTGTFTGLAADTYSYTVTDANGCTSNVSVTITQPIQVTISATSTNVSCNGAADGTITATASAGATITVDGQPYNAAATYGPGTYTVTATAPNGNGNGNCTASTTVTITEPTKVTITGSARNVSCFGANNGGLLGSFTPAGTATLTIRNSSNVDVTATNGSYGPGTYTATASAPNGNNNGFCTASITLTITEPAQVTVSATPTNVSCNGAADGKIIASSSAGSTITVNGNPYDANATYTPGTYTVTATAPNGNNNGSCTATTMVTITEPIAVTVNATSTNVSCNGAADGTITASASSGASITVNGQPYVANASYVPGSYTVTATAPNGNGNGNCTATTTVNITQPIPVTINATSTNVTCSGAANGTITATASTGATITVNGQPYNANAMYGPGSYNVVATAPNGNGNGNCTASTTVTITQPAATTTVSLVSKTNNTCNGGTTGTINVSASGGSGGYNYTITTGSTINTTGATNGMFTGLAAGTYTITATDANGCSGSLSGITITQPPSTTPDGSVSVADFTDNFFPANASEVTIVFQVTENAGNPITSARLRTTKQGTSYAFSLLNQSSIIIGGTNYPLANANWTQDNSSNTFYDLNMNSGNQVSCGQSVYLAVKITRNTSNKSTFTLTSVLQQITGETATSNNATTFILVAQ